MALSGHAGEAGYRASLAVWRRTLGNTFLYEFRTRFGNHHLQIGLLLGVHNCGRSACRLVEYHHLGDEDLDVSDVRKRRSTPRRKPYGPRGDDTPPRRGFAERFDISLNWLICGDEMFSVPDKEWERYVEKGERDKMLCKPCYDQIKIWDVHERVMGELSVMRMARPERRQTRSRLYWRSLDKRRCSRATRRWRVPSTTVFPISIRSTTSRSSSYGAIGRDQPMRPRRTTSSCRESTSPLMESRPGCGTAAEGARTQAVIPPAPTERQYALRRRPLAVAAIAAGAAAPPIRI